MENLADNPGCDVVIASELYRCRIMAVSVSRSATEVPYTLEGLLGRFVFRRYWHYWVVTGPVPLAVAQELYADPVGVTDIRVAGHCGCPPPAEWFVWRHPDGKQVLSLAQQQEALACLHHDSPALRNSGQCALDRYHYSDDPAEEFAAQPFVELYHIDTEVGLRVFVDTLRQYGLAGKGQQDD